MQGYTRAEMKALAVPVHTMLTLHLPGQPLPLAWLGMRPSVQFTQEFWLPAFFADLVEVVTSRTLTLLCGDCPAWLQTAGRRAEEVEVERLQPVLAESLTLALDADGCNWLVRFLLGWGASHKEIGASQ